MAVAATVRAAAERRGRLLGAGEPRVAAEDVRLAVRQHKAGALVVLVVDASGSMGPRMAAVKGAVVSLLLDAYQRRDRVALVVLAGGGAHVALRPTGSVEVARARLDRLPTGGRTDLAAGLRAGRALCDRPADGRRPLLVVITDGRATAGPDGADPVVAAEDEAVRVRRQGIAAVVVDVEAGPMGLGLAERLATSLGGRHLRLPDLTAEALEATIRGVLPADS